MLYISYQPVQLLFLGGATLFLLNAILYSFQTLANIGLARKVSSQHILSLLVFTNIAMYVLSLFAFLGACLAGPDLKAARLILIVALFACVAQISSVYLLAPVNWQKTIPCVLGAALIAIGLALGSHA